MTALSVPLFRVQYLPSRQSLPLAVRNDRATVFSLCMCVSMYAREGMPVVNSKVNSSVHAPTSRTVPPRNECSSACAENERDRVCLHRRRRPRRMVAGSLRVWFALLQRCGQTLPRVCIPSSL